MRILVVDDEHRIARSIKQGLEQDGYAVDIEHDGESAYHTATADDYDAIVLDVMMPGMNGYEVVKKLRQDGNHTPVLLLTAKTQSRDVVGGLDAGADDYLAKPFSFDVLTARLRALLRRPHVALDSVLVVRDVELDSTNHTVSRAGKPISLSVKEFAILEYLMRNKNRIMSKNNIMTHVWDFDADILPNNVEVFINYLRRKLDKPFSDEAPIIQTVRGFGYVIKDES
jgi:DNA-binding response OmpR family regulator